MGFFDDIGKLLRQAAPIAGSVIGGSLGGPAGAAVGSSLGGAIGRGKLDPRQALTDAATGYAGNRLTSGIAGRLGLGGGDAPDLGTMDWRKQVGMTPTSAAASAAPGAGPTGASGADNGLWARLTSGKGLSALGHAAEGITGAMQQNRYYDLQQKQYEEALAQRKREEARSSALDPARAQVFAALAKRLGIQ